MDIHTVQYVADKVDCNMDKNVEGSVYVNFENNENDKVVVKKDNLQSAMQMNLKWVSKQ